MPTPYYPPLTAEQIVPLRAIKGLLVNRPDMLDVPDCPYSPDVTAFLKELLQTKVSDLPQQAEIISLEDPDAIGDQLEQIYSNLMTFQNDIKTTDAKDKVQWAKAVVSILERIISQRERVFNLKNYSHFQRQVIDFLDAILEPSQRTDFVERLGTYLEQSKQKDPE